jgi:hypothetical protein
MNNNNEKNQLSQSVFDLFKESFIKVCTESTSHGLPNIFKTKNWIIRIFWLALFLAGSGGALYCIYLLCLFPLKAYMTKKNNKKLKHALKIQLFR